MLSQLTAAAKVVGVKQSRKAIRDGKAARVYIALDAEQRVLRPICDVIWMFRWKKSPPWPSSVMPV